MDNKQSISGPMESSVRQPAIYQESFASEGDEENDARAFEYRGNIAAGELA